MSIRFYVALLRAGGHKSVYIPGIKTEIPISNMQNIVSDVSETLDTISWTRADLLQPVIGIIKKTKDYLEDEGRPLSDFIKVVDINMEV